MFTRLGSFIDVEGIGGAQIFRNRLRLGEGPGAIDAEHIAGLSAGIHQTMVNSDPESVNNDEPISIFSRWPKDWDAAFRLLARGAFVISAAQKWRHPSRGGSSRRPAGPFASRTRGTRR